MTRLITTLFVLILLCSAVGQAQWNFAGAFPDTNFKGVSGAHGAAVSPDGKVWLVHYGSSSPVADSIPTPTGMRAVRPVFVFNPNGTPASFSPIKVIVGPTFRDTLFTTNTNRGMRVDISGNILVSIFDMVYRINYQTGAGMNKVISGGGNAVGSAGVDTLGEIFVATVAPGFPIKIYGSNFASLGNVTDTSVGFHRSFEVSKNGNDVYWAGYTNHAIYRYHSDFGSFGPYTVGPNDTLLKGFDCESMAWNPSRTRLWLSAGSKNDLPNRYPGVTTNYRINTWYAWNPANGQLTDSIFWDWRFSRDSANQRPRAIAFSPDGNTAYVGCFGASTVPDYQKFTRVSSVEPDPGVLPTGFILAQNYPNPFNPTTQIKFTLDQAGATSLLVYDITGRVVADLVSGNLQAGGYVAKFDATNLASGTYFYTLTHNGVSLSKKMLLTK